ncbi:MAG: Crp/Fnr family transcriptional regulator [Pseudomonadota bacterium]
MNSRPWPLKNIDLLLNTPLFSICSAQDWEAIKRFTRHRSLMSQEVLFWQNDACEAFYYLLTGHFKLCRRNQQTKHIIGFVEPGQMFAESAVYAGDGYPYTAVATEDAELIVIQAYPFTRFLNSHPQLASRFLAHISRLLHHQLNERERLNMQSAEQKIAAYLLTPCKENKMEKPVCRLPARRIDLANMLLMTPETLSRTLKRFKDTHMIEEQQGQIMVTDPTALRSLLT